jgi:hypothetical protein
MRRSIRVLFCLSLLSAVSAEAQQRPSLSSLDAAQKRTNSAMCAKADADGDSYRPFFCDPRCDCLAPLLLQGSPNICEESSPGVFDIAITGPPTCTNGYCVGVATGSCNASVNFCGPGQVCVASCFLTACTYRCELPCTSDATCPPIPGPIAKLSGVSEPDSPHAVNCDVLLTPLDPATATSTKINSNDALACLEQVETSTGPCQ